MSDGVLQSVAAGLAFWPAVFLLAGGIGKALDVRSDAARGTIAARILPGTIPLRPAWALVAAAELVVGALVLAAVFAPWPEAAATLLLAGATATAVWGLTHAPDADCGCFGAIAAARVRPRTAVRAGVLAALAGVAALSGDGWTSVFDHWQAILVVLAAGVVLVFLSPEPAEVWESARPATLSAVGDVLFRVDRVRNAACERRRVPLERTVARLKDSDLWRRARPYVTAEAPTENWDEGCWRLITYPAVYEGEPATAVFKVALGRRRSGDAVAFVNEEEQKILGRLEAGSAP